MAITLQYIVSHKGEEKLTTTDKKEADRYDKMLDVADNLADFIGKSDVGIEDSALEELSILLSKEKDSVIKILKGKKINEL